MNVDCYPVTALPHISPLFRDYFSGFAGDGENKLLPFYSSYHRGNEWMRHPPAMENQQRQTIADLLRTQNLQFDAGLETQANLDKLAAGAGAVVTGQQAGLFGGPLLTLLKAATAIRLAADATSAGHPHVPIFWVASEDHDFDEVNQATVFADPNMYTASLHTLRLPENPSPGRPVGTIPLGADILPLIEEMERCIGPGEIFDLLESFYTPAATFSSAFGRLLSHLFRKHGLIVIDAAARPFHALAPQILQAAIEHADDLQAALLRRTQQLEAAGYHAQVTVGGSSSLLFLIEETTGIRTALKKIPGGKWSAGPRQYSEAELLSILRETPERISPNVLLRPILQDNLLPTSAYVGGPAEIAYFAQSQIVYERILGRVTPVLPRYSATVIEPALTKILHQHQLSLPDVFSSSNALAQLLGARTMPVEGKRKLAAAGNALERELQLLREWMHSLDQGLGHSADVAASKMLYQMNRLRRLSAGFTLQREQSLQRHAEVLCTRLFPGGNLQERVLAGAWFLSRVGPGFTDLLVEQAKTGVCGHAALHL